jgi:hypothetical protein
MNGPFFVQAKDFHFKARNPIIVCLIVASGSLNRSSCRVWAQSLFYVCLLASL